MNSADPNNRLVSTLEALSHETSIDDEEAMEILTDAGLDPEQALQELKQAIANEDEKIRLERFDQAVQRRQEALAGPKVPRT